MLLEPGQSLGHYRIVRLIGQGGMGAVFLAEDTRLHRNVALKVLPGEMASDAGRLARFQREAQAVAALNHPHIVTLYSVEEEGDTHFLTMELVEGESLDHRLARGPLPLAKVFDIGIALADALAAAHDKGIIHRDLKPANVMVTKDGRVKVLDFGLAKLALEPPGASPAGTPRTGTEATASTAMNRRDDSLTAAGVVMGTVPYMSPEQVGGEMVDTRTDIFSLGVVLYELATGSRPFGGKNKAETISSILRDSRRGPPRRAAASGAHHRSLPAEGSRGPFSDGQGCAQRAARPAKGSGVGREPSWWHGPGNIRGCDRLQLASKPSRWDPSGNIHPRGLEPRLADQPCRRHAPGGIHACDLRTLDFGPQCPGTTHRQGSLDRPRRCGDGDYRARADRGAGPPDALAKIPQLRVTSRSSAFSFKGQKLEISEIARRLNVAHVLEGSVRKSGKQVRITAQLIKADSDTHLWSQTYDRTLDDIFAIQDEIASDVVKQLQVTFLGAAPVVRKTTPEAYALYLQAVQLGRQITAEGFGRSDALFRKVLEIDPSYAPAWGELARNSLNETTVGLLSNEEGLRRAGEEAGKALAIDPGYAPAHANLGRIAMYRSDLSGAVRHFERALELAPENLYVLANAATLLDSLGRLDDGLAIREWVVARDPVNAIVLYNLAISYVSVGRLDEAIASYRTALSLSPERGVAHTLFGVALLQKGEPEAALEEILQETSQTDRRIGLPMAYQALGRKAESDAALAELIDRHEKDAPYNIAYVLAFRSEADRAFEWLDKAVEYGDPGLSEILSESLFANIRKDPRWLPFLRKIGKAPEQLAAIQFNVKLPEQ